MGKQQTADTCVETARWRSLVKIAALMNFGEGIERLDRRMLAMGLKVFFFSVSDTFLFCVLFIYLFLF